jgi:hypothetical protein
MAWIRWTASSAHRLARHDALRQLLPGDRRASGSEGSDNVNVVTVTLQEADPLIADADLEWRDIASTVHARSGTTVASTHAGIVDVPVTGNERRLLIEDAEPVSIESGGALLDSTIVAYREVVDIPANW